MIICVSIVDILKKHKGTQLPSQMTYWLNILTLLQLLQQSRPLYIPFISLYEALIDTSFMETVQKQEGTHHI